MSNILAASSEQFLINRKFGWRPCYHVDEPAAEISMVKILVVEDDAFLAGTIRDALTAEQHKVEVTHSGAEADGLLTSFQYDLVVLDWDLPQVSGLSICRNFRARGGHTPVLMLTGKTSTDDKESGLDAGADDYLTKPFEIRELNARIRALLRRPMQFQGNELIWNDFVLDTETHTLKRGGDEIALQPMEFAVLELFMKHPGHVFSTDALLSRCWSADTAASQESLYTMIRKLRKKLDIDGKKSIIQTVHGIGYRHDPE